MSRCSLIPHRMTASVAVDYQTHGRNYLLWRDSHTILIQVANVWDPLPDDLDARTVRVEKEQQETNHRLEIIQSLLDHGKFGLSNWGYLVTLADGSYRIMYRNYTIRRISCCTWAPLVDESELEITQWVTMDVQLAIWRNREVQLFVAYDDPTAEWVEEEMKARRLLLGLDVSFEVLGHVVRHGQVVGLIFEPQVGRPMRQSDRAIVFEAVAKLQSHGLIFRDDCTYSNANIMISQGKVRFRYTSHIVQFNKDDVEAMDKYQHWEALEELFDTLETTCMFWLDYRILGQHAVLIPNLPSPELPLIGTRDLLIRLELYSLIPFFDASEKPSQSPKSRGRRKSKRLGCTVLPIAPVDSCWEGKHQQCLEDQPFRVQGDLSLTPRRTRHPRYSQKTRRTMLLLPSEAPNDDKSSPSHQSESEIAV